MSYTGHNIPLTDYVEVDGTDLSTDCRVFTPSSEFALIGASGFNAGGNDENLVGSRTSSATATFFDTSAVYGVLWYAHVNKSIVSLVHRKDQNNVTSADNPEFSGNVYVRTFTPGRTRGDVATFDCEFVAADADGLSWSAS